MKYTLYLVLLVLIPFFASSQQFPERPNPPKLVNDFTGTLSADEVKALENKLVAYNDSTSTQIAIVMLTSLDGYPADDYAIKLGELWGIGQKGKNNGVLVFVAKDDRKIFISVGYGIEGVMPDGLIKRIIENDIKPAFREGNYYKGFDVATDNMFKLAAGEYKADARSAKKDTPPVWIIIGIIFFIIIIVFSKINSVKSYSSMNGISFWAALALLNQSRRTHHGSWGGFSGGGGFGGGGGGGGFGGFGGGSFGGGGAGGSW